jgi:hypothetical protein
MSETALKMPTKRKPQAKTSARGLGWRHQQAVATLRRNHRDGAPCDWCGKPLYLDRTRNWDHDPDRNHLSGVLHGDHAGLSRTEAIRLGKPIPLPNRLLHQTCNIQRGTGGMDHLAATNTANIDTSKLAMPWPW